MSASARIATVRGTPVLLIDQPPEFAGSPRDCAARALMFGRPVSSCIMPEAIPPGRRRALRETVDAVAAGDLLISAYHAADALCRDGVCRPVRGDRSLFVDFDHLSEEGARFYAPRLLDPLLRALAQRDWDQTVPRRP